MIKENEQLDDPDYDRILQMQDFFPKIFLQPCQIRLDKQAGLKIIRRYPNQPDKYEQEQVKPILIDQKQIEKFTINPQRDEYGQVEYPAGHGLLSLFKRTKDRRIKLAICICVYSESKHMLKTTIKGIQESNRDFFQKAGIMSHEIIVVVIFDGLQNINSSKDQTQNMISFFNEIDIKNGFRQRSNSLSLDEFLKQIEQNKIDFNNFNDDKIGQINLFTEDELTQLQPKLFQNQFNLYIKTKKLLTSIQKYKLEKEFKLDLLPYDVVKKYEQLCVNFCAENNYWFETQEEIQEYLNGPRKNIRFRLIYEALCEVEDLCIRYLQSRQDKVLLYPVRMEKDYLKNPRLEQNIEDQFSSLIDQSEKKEYNYMFLCVKHKNQGKLNSHMIFFEGFCKLFDPVYCILTDVGVKPQEDAIFKIYKYFELNPKCGGVCGYMSLKIENPSDQYGYRFDGYDEDEVDCITRCFNYFVSVQRAQQFEYHYAHMLDKPFESCFNYIHVLPGAFSGYRWRALKSVRFSKDYVEQYNNQINSQRYLNYKQNEEQSQEETLLNKYLKTALLTQSNELSLEQSNMYLAEDRILCLGIHALGYDLNYLPDVESYVDPVTSLTKLLGQRRRWINGSWFAFNYVRQNSDQIRSIVFMIQLLYYSLIQKLQWIGPAMFYLAMNLTLIAFVTNNVVPAIERFFKIEQNFQLSYYTVFFVFNIKQVLLSIPDIMNYAYIIAMMAVVLWSAMSNHNNNKFKSIYYAASTLIGIYGLLVLALLVYNTVQIIQATSTQHINEKEQFFVPLIYLRALILFIIIGFALPILWTFSFKKTVEMITCLFSYIYYTPTYINILQIFAFTRVDDLSWGTKGLDKQSETSTIQQDWQKRKYYFILQYITTNVLVAYLLARMAKYDAARNIIILSTTILGVFLLAFRLIFAIIYLTKYYLVRCCQKLSNESINENRKNGYKIYNALKLIEMKIKQVEKERTKRKKVEEFKSLASMTSIILSKALSNFGKKIRNKVAKHIVSNSLFPKKELMDPFKKRLKGKKTSLMKDRLQQRIKTMNTMNSIGSIASKIEKQQIKAIAEQQQNDSLPQGKEKERIVASENESNGNDKKQIKTILKSIRERYKSKIK